MKKRNADFLRLAYVSFPLGHDLVAVEADGSALFIGIEAEHSDVRSIKYLRHEQVVHKICKVGIHVAVNSYLANARTDCTDLVAPVGKFFSKGFALVLGKIADILIATTTKLNVSYADGIQNIHLLVNVFCRLICKTRNNKFAHLPIPPLFFIDMITQICRSCQVT